MKSLFFSGDVTQDGTLDRFCKTHSLELTAQSLLKFEAVPFAISKPFEVVFFSSIRSYNYFVSGISDLSSVSLACVGQQTAEKINEKNHSLSFVGTTAGDPEKVALEFKAWLGERRVLFPVSRQSAGTIAKAIPDEQKELVVCYETQLVDAVIDRHDLYVFTSPTNVEAFLKNNKVPSGAKFIAWGKTTEKKLIEKNLVCDAVLKESSEEELVRILESILDNR